MGDVTIYFVGICTHMQWPQDDTWAKVPGFEHRVVLVNGTLPHVINGTAIPSHTATLRIPAQDIRIGDQSAETAPDTVLTWRLDGVHLEIARGIDALRYDESYECCIPHLKKLTPDLPRPSAVMVTEGLPEQASCYFEIEWGVLSAGRVANSAAAVLSVRTEGDPVLRVRRFRDVVPSEIPLRTGAQIAILNTGAFGEDDPNDFLLHYETAESVPPNAAVPGSIADCCKPLAPNAVVPPLNVGPGCSNSIFP